MKLSVQKFPIYASKEHLVADLASAEIKKVCLKYLADSIPCSATGLRVCGA